MDSSHITDAIEALQREKELRATAAELRSAKLGIGLTAGEERLCEAAAAIVERQADACRRNAEQMLTEVPAPA